MIDGFFIRALISGVGIALVTGPLGGFVLWRRLSFFVDTLFFAAFLGVSFLLFFYLNIFLSVFFFSTIFALILICLQTNTNLS